MGVVRDGIMKANINAPAGVPSPGADQTIGGGLMHRTIPLSRGLVAVVDPADYEWLSAFRWHASPGSKTFYACRHLKAYEGKGTVSMHRLIMNATERHIQVDHVDRDGLNNRRANLRLCGASHNQGNTPQHKDNTSGYRGVFWHKGARRWRAQITCDGHYVHLGYHATAELAAQAYDFAAFDRWGKYAHLNFPGLGERC